MARKISVLLLFLECVAVVMCYSEMEILLRVKDKLDDPSHNLGDWVSTDTSPCKWRGLVCNDEGSVIHVDLRGNNLSGRIPAELCVLQNLTFIDLSCNSLYGGLPFEFLNCSRLEQLALDHNFLNGTVPDLSGFKALKYLDISYNSFSGDFPVSVGSLTTLTTLCVGFNKWNRRTFPMELLNLVNVQWLYLTRANLHGPVPSAISNMTSLRILELSENAFTGNIPKEISLLTNLERLELYRNFFVGEIPKELGNLTLLEDIDASRNFLTGTIPEGFGKLKNLSYIQLYNNSLTGSIPEGFGNLSKLVGMSLYQNHLSGPLPATLGATASMIFIDVSQNSLSGPLPPSLCNERAALQNVLVLDNQFSGTIPESYGNCSGMIRFRLNKNRLCGAVPKGIWEFPHLSILDLSYNQLEGRIARGIGNALNLSELYLQHNLLSGPLPREVGSLTKLVKVDISDNSINGSIPAEIGKLSVLSSLLLQGNSFSGIIPMEIGRCKLLSSLNLANNKLTGSIPASIGNIEMLNFLNLSSNMLTGEIPNGLATLKLSSIDFSSNLLSGPVPIELINEGTSHTFKMNSGLCGPGLRLHPCDPKSQDVYRERWESGWIISVMIIVIVIGVMVIRRRRRSHGERNRYRTAFWDKVVFHKLSFDEQEVLDCMDEDHAIGRGGSGIVYRIQLSNGESVAVKKLFSCKDGLSANGASEGLRELRAEVDTLGTIRHKNIVKLYCCFSNGDSNLLVYEYMPNGNLWESIHGGGGVSMSWPVRYKIALGVANGLSYLHHDCLPPIIHRDVKSTNILLDADYQARVADFGFAKILQACARGENSIAIAGTHGYIAPEYAYSAKVSEKSDVYSFGVVLLELITGKCPVEPEFGENKDIVNWISRRVISKEGAIEVLDQKICENYKDDMIQALKIAVRCTSTLPSLRPSMREVVQMLIEINPKEEADVKGSKQISHVELQVSPTKDKDCKLVSNCKL